MPSFANLPTQLQGLLSKSTAEKRDNTNMTLNFGVCRRKVSTVTQKQLCTPPQRQRSVYVGRPHASTAASRSSEHQQNLGEKRILVHLMHDRLSYPILSYGQQVTVALLLPVSASTSFGNLLLGLLLAPDELFSWTKQKQSVRGDPQQEAERTHSSRKGQGNGRNEECAVSALLLFCQTGA